MATGTRTCKVCGKEYPYCRTERRLDIFRWQDVACSPEHGNIYFAEVEAARAPKPIVEGQTNTTEASEAVAAIETVETTEAVEKKPAAKASRKKQS